LTPNTYNTVTVTNNVNIHSTSYYGNGTWFYVYNNTGGTLQINSITSTFIGNFSSGTTLNISLNTTCFLYATTSNWVVLENNYYMDTTLNVSNYLNMISNITSITSLNTSINTSLNSRITVDETNINNTIASINTINSRISTDTTYLSYIFQGSTQVTTSSYLTPNSYNTVCGGVSNVLLHSAPYYGNGTWIYVYNSSGSTLQIDDVTSTFIGNFSSGTNMLYMSVNTTCFLYASGSNWVVLENNYYVDTTLNTLNYLNGISTITRLTNDETNINSLLSNTSNITYSSGTTNFNDNVQIGASGTSFILSLNGQSMNTIQPVFTIGSIISVGYGNSPSVSVTGAYPNYVLNFTLETGNQGPQGNTGSQGPQGSTGATGPEGDSSVATASAVAAAASATAAALSAATAEASATASATSCAAAEASVAGIQTQVNTLSTEVTTLNTDVDNLQVQTTGMSYTGGITTFSGSLSSSSLTASTINSSNIGTSDSVVNIGNLTSAVYIGGILYDPFSSPTFFSQW